MSENITIPAKSEQTGGGKTWMTGDNGIDGTGLHKATIKEVRYLRDKAGEIKYNKNGEPAMQFVLEDENGLTHSEHFWFSPDFEKPSKSQWRLDQWIASLKIDNAKEFDAGKCIGVSLLVAIQDIHIVVNGQPKMRVVGDNEYPVIRHSLFKHFPIDATPNISSEEYKKTEEDTPRPGVPVQAPTAQAPMPQSQEESHPAEWDDASNDPM